MTAVCGTAPAYRRRIARYYDRTQMLYSALWSPTRVHYGLWDDGTANREYAVQNLDRMVADLLALPPGARVLDAGCGIGGTSLWLSDQRGFAMVGITVSRVQLRRATHLARASRTPMPPRYLLADYMETGFGPATFDGMIAIESACYADPPSRFAEEAFRVLRPGARLVVADGFTSDAGVPSRQRTAYRRLLDGFALRRLAGVEEFGQALRGAGFRDVRCVDHRTAIMRSAYAIEALSYAGLAVCALPCLLRLLPRTWFRHGLAGISQRRLFASGTIEYRTFVATKPGEAVDLARSIV